MCNVSLVQDLLNMAILIMRASSKGKLALVRFVNINGLKMGFIYFEMLIVYSNSDHYIFGSM